MSTYTPETLRELADQSTAMADDVRYSPQWANAAEVKLRAAAGVLRSYADVIERARVTDEMVQTAIDIYWAARSRWPASTRLHMPMRAALTAALAKVLGEG